MTDAKPTVHRTGALLSHERQGRIGAVCLDASGAVFCVTAARVTGDPFLNKRDQKLSACDLLVHIPAPGAIGGPQQPLSIVPHTHALTEAVFRQVGDTRAPGRVTALHGAIRVAGGAQWVNGLIEVEFSATDERGGSNDPMPPLTADELGTLIMTYEGGAIGLIVGGSGHVALVAPLSAYCALNALTLAKSDYDKSDPRVGFDFLYNELSRTPMLNLGDVPEAA